MALAESSSATDSRRGPVAIAGRDADRTVVWLRGEHDVSTVAALSATLARAIALDDADLVVDLSGVQFMDAATIGVITRARDFLRVQSRSLALRSPSTCAGRIIDLCDLTYLLDPRPLDVSRTKGTAGALGRLVAVSATNRVDLRPVPEADLQQRVRRGDAALLSLLRLDERTHAHRGSLARKTVARLKIARPSRSTRFARPS